MALFKRCIGALATAFVLAGCLSIDRETELAIANLRSGNYESAIAWSEDLANSSVYSKRLGEVEAGRANMIAGNNQAASAWFRKAIDEAIDRSEAQPKIKIGDVGNTLLASTVTDDRMRDYELAPYELNLALEYAIISEEACSRRDEALVDCRLAAYVQDSLAETYGADIVKESENISTNAAADGVYREQTAGLDEAIAATRNSWENPLLWWLTGVVFEADGDRDSAEQSYKRAAAIMPGNKVFAEDAAMVAKRRSPAKGKAKLVVICGEGFVSRRYSFKAPIPVYTGFGVHIPMYRDETYRPRMVAVSLDGAAPTYAESALNVQSLAYRDLKEHLPGIITRNVTRAVTAATAQAAVNASGNNYARIAVFAANAVAAAIREADTRSWATLPMGEQIWRSDAIQPGTHRIDVTSGYGGVPASATVTLAPGETKIVYLNTKD
ncbi:MAG: hypothetical protein J6P13_04100 [Kiritimatiellae bacterium]|nr:hypothetical protein [Kiritimatiellia bacterium]